jgi:3-hydroxyisobutyrate dehydrogenase-like beta-hydroxyacid dehydrogenase
MSSSIAAEHARRGQNYVAAPVFGNPDAAKARELFIIAAGPSDQIDRCRPILDLVGQRTFLIGNNPASANLVKLAGNAMTATTLEALGEVLALLRKHGVEPENAKIMLDATLVD